MSRSSVKFFDGIGRRQVMCWKDRQESLALPAPAQQGYAYLTTMTKGSDAIPFATTSRWVRL